MKTEVVLFSLMLTVMIVGCTSGDGWQSVEISLPAGAPEVVYERKPYSAFQFVGTEQARRLRIGDTTIVDLPVQPSLHGQRLPGA